MINMELEFKHSALKQLKSYKKKNPIAYKIIREQLGEVVKNPEDIRYKKVKRYPKYKRARKRNYHRGGQEGARDVSRLRAPEGLFHEDGQGRPGRNVRQASAGFRRGKGRTAEAELLRR